MRVWVLLAFGSEAAAEFTEKMGVPFFLYKILDYIAEQNLPRPY